MKKLLLATAIATLSMSSVQAAPTLYGKLNVSLDQVWDDMEGASDTDSMTQLDSNASRIGVKGEEGLTDNIAVVYLAEWEVSTDGNSSADLGMRNRYLGLDFKNVGTLKVGRFDSYFKTAAGSKQDIFNDTILDITNVIFGEERLSNVIGFETDKNLLGGVQLNAMIQQGEEDGHSTGTTGDDSERSDLADSASLSAVYSNKDIGLALAAAADIAVKGKYNGLDGMKYYSDAYRITGSYDFGATAGIEGLVLGALWQTAEPTDEVTAYKDLQEDAWGISAAYTIPSTPITVKGQYVGAKTDWDGGEQKVREYGIAADYRLNKATKVYGMLGQIDWEDVNERTVLGLGMEYNF